MLKRLRQKPVGQDWRGCLGHFDVIICISITEADLLSSQEKCLWGLVLTFGFNYRTNHGRKCQTHGWQGISEGPSVLGYSVCWWWFKDSLFKKEHFWGLSHRWSCWYFTEQKKKQPRCTLLPGLPGLWVEFHKYWCQLDPVSLGG